MASGVVALFRAEPNLPFTRLEFQYLRFRFLFLAGSHPLFFFKFSFSFERLLNPPPPGLPAVLTSSLRDRRLSLSALPLIECFFPISSLFFQFPTFLFFPFALIGGFGRAEEFLAHCSFSHSLLGVGQISPPPPPHQFSCFCLSGLSLGRGRVPSFRTVTCRALSCPPPAASLV